MQNWHRIVNGNDIQGDNGQQPIMPGVTNTNHQYQAKVRTFDELGWTKSDGNPVTLDDVKAIFGGLYESNKEELKMQNNGQQQLTAEQLQALMMLQQQQGQQSPSFMDSIFNSTIGRIGVIGGGIGAGYLLSKVFGNNSESVHQALNAMMQGVDNASNGVNIGGIENLF